MRKVIKKYKRKNSYKRKMFHPNYILSLIITLFSIGTIITFSSAYMPSKIKIAMLVFGIILVAISFFIAITSTEYYNKYLELYPEDNTSQN